MENKNITDDQKLRELFGLFNPDTGSDVQFIRTLEKRLDAVELIRKHNAQVVHNMRNAAVAAACAGFICGFLFSLALPYIGVVANQIMTSVPRNSFLSVVATNYVLISWIIISILTGTLSLNTYHLYMTLVQRK